MHLVGAAIYGVRGRAVKPADVPDGRLRGAIESRFGILQRWIASSQVLLAIAGDAARPIAKLIPVRGPGRCSITIPHRASAPNITGLRFFCGIFSAFAWQPPVPRRRLRRAMAAEKPGSVSCRSSLRQRCRGFAACLPQAREISRIAVKCLNAGPDWSATRQWPGPLSASRRTKSARLAAVAWPSTISASIAT
jgi:hypothetical protein